ncbi:related to protein SOK1 [Zygosaccharomyces bailii]|nr:related to protein SOK1 [Zygosaccharomyces bailii]
MEQARPHRSTVTSAASPSQPQTTVTGSPSPTTTTTTTTATTTSAASTVAATSTTTEQKSHGGNNGEEMNTNKEGSNAPNNANQHKRLSTCSQEHAPEAGAQGTLPPTGSLLVSKYTEFVSSIGNHFTSNSGPPRHDEVHDQDDDNSNDNDDDQDQDEVQDENLDSNTGSNCLEGNSLFKQFDHKTGQFLRREPQESDAHNGVKRLFANKFRSHSVPAISHSSLKRLTTYCQNHHHYHYHQHAASGAVQKKRASRLHHHHHRHHHNHCFVQATPVAALGNSNTSTGSSGSSRSSSRKSGSSSSSSSSSSSGGSSSNGSSGIRHATGGNDTGVTSFGDESKHSTAAQASTDALGDASTGRTTAINRNKNLMAGNALRNAILLCHQTQPSPTKYEELTLQERINAIRKQPGPLPLPPINLQCLREIDLQEIVKNPQLRHDIIFDPLLQFRPNLDGERGIKKKQLADKYWNDVKNEVFVYSQSPQVFQYNHTRLVPLFDTLREVLLTIVPQRETHVIHNILDTELNVQELLRGSLIMTNLSEWLAQLFKHHCAPMRDTWVDKMSAKFKEAEQESSLSKLIEGLRLVFQILEAMKLDIANHQIRILRPALLSNSVEFEKQYFQSLMSSDRVDLKSSLVWFSRKFEESVSQGRLQRGQAAPRDIYKLCIQSVISLLSCRKMVREYPTSLSFDHARLILLRADIRQIVCLLICRLLFKQLVANDTLLDKGAKSYIDSAGTLKRLKGEIVSIITDEHGNCRWTKNTMAIAIHLCKTITDLRDEYWARRGDTVESCGSSSSNANTAAPYSTPTLAQAKVDFAKSWLSKQTQPLSEVYGVLEDRVFRSLEELIFARSECTVDGRVKQDFVHLCSQSTTESINNLLTPPRDNSGTSVMAPSVATSSMTAAVPAPVSPAQAQTATAKATMQGLDMEEFDNVFRHLYAVINFHWSVFGSHYMDALGEQKGARVF